MASVNGPDKKGPGVSSKRATYIAGASLAAVVVLAAAFLSRSKERIAAVEPPLSSSETPVPSVVLVVPPHTPASRVAGTASPTSNVRHDLPPPAPLPPIDLFGRDAPELLSKTHEATMRGEVLTVEREKELYQLGKDHPGDARPHLVMAEDAMNRGWDEFAVNHYRRAQREDPRARQDPRMLKDLVSLAGGKHNGAKAADAITDIYGSSAISAVEEALGEAGDKGDQDRVQQLASLSRALATPSP